MDPDTEDAHSTSSSNCHISRELVEDVAQIYVDHGFDKPNPMDYPTDADILAKTLLAKSNVKRKLPFLAEVLNLSFTKTTSVTDDMQLAATSPHTPITTGATVTPTTKKLRSGQRQTTMKEAGYTAACTHAKKKDPDSSSDEYDSADDFEHGSAAKLMKISPGQKKKTQNKDSKKKKKTKNPNTLNTKTSTDLRMDHVPARNKIEVPAFPTVTYPTKLAARAYENPRVYFSLLNDPRIYTFDAETIDSSSCCIKCGKLKAECHEVLFGGWCMSHVVNYQREVGTKNITHDNIYQRYRYAYNNAISFVIYKTEEVLDTNKFYYPPPCMLENSLASITKLIMYEREKQRWISDQLRL